MKFFLLIAIFLLPLLKTAPMIPISNLEAQDNIADGLGFTLLVPDQKTINFTLTSYSKLNPSQWMEISYPNTKTYANVSISLQNVDGCKIDVSPKGSGIYECSFKLRFNNNNFDVNFNAKSNDNDINQFKMQFSQLCGPHNLLNIEKKFE